MNLFKKLALTAAIALSAGGASATSLSTSFAGGNGQSGNMFDITVGATDLTLQSFEINADSSGTYEFYIVSGGITGNLNNSSAWTLVSSNALVTNGSNTPTLFDVLDTVLLANTTYGIYITGNGTGVSYSNGTGVGNVAATNADLTIYEGYGVQYAFGSTFSPRIWNGTVNYVTGTLPTVPLPASSLMLLGALGAIAMGRREKGKVQA